MSAAAPPPALVAGLEKLRRALMPGLTCPPKKLIPLLLDHRELLIHLTTGLIPAIKASQPILAASMRLLVSEGTVPATVLALLRRLHATPPAVPARRPLNLEASAACADTAMYTVVTSFSLLAVLTPLVKAAQTALSPDAQDAAGEFMLAVAQAQPCADVVATLLLIQAGVAGGGPTAHRPASQGPAPAGASAAYLAEMGRLSATTAHFGCELLEHSLMVEPFAAVLREGATASRLLHHTCEALTHTLVGLYGALQGGLRGSLDDTLGPAVGAVQALASVVSLCAASAADGGPLARGQGARAASLRTIFAEPAFPRMLLAALMQFSGPRTLTPAGVRGAGAAAASQTHSSNDILAVTRMLLFWLTPPGASDAQEGERRRLAAQVGVTALQVAHVAKASAACACEESGDAVRLLYQLLPPAERAFALPAVAAHAGALLDRLTKWYASGGTSHVFVRDGFAKWAEDMDPGRCSQLAVDLVFHLVTDDATSTSGKVPLPRAASRCVMKLGLLGKCEVLLRACTLVPSPGTSAGGRCATPKRGPDDDARHCMTAQLACKAATAVLAQLLDDDQQAGPALASLQCLLVTTRKLIVRVTAIDSLAAAAAADGAGGLPARLLPCMAIAALLEAPGLGLGAARLAVRPAAILAARACALQLLPALMQGCTAYVSAQPRDGRDWTWAQLAVLDAPLRLLSSLHNAFIADATLGAGAPALLQAVLGALPPSDSRAVQDTVMLVLDVVCTGALCQEWLVEAARVGMGGPGGLAAWADPRTPRLAAATAADRVPQHLSSAVALTSLAAMSMLQKAQSQAPPAAAAPVRSLEWDACALATEAAANAGGCVPFLGCWHTGCTNVEGGSEGTLKLLRCSSCKLARYCSVACQKQAWAGGHRGACGLWMGYRKAEAAFGSTGEV